MRLGDSNKYFIQIMHGYKHWNSSEETKVCVSLLVSIND